MDYISSHVVALLLAEGNGAATLPLTMLLVFGSAKLLAEVFERCRQPGLVGEILAGVLLGPGLLGWVTPDRFLAAFSQLGVMFLLFRIGLDVKPRELIRLGKTATAAGALGVVIPFLGGWGILLLWGRPNLEAIFVGAALTATSVGVSAQILAGKGLLSRTASQIILAAAVIDDVLALLVLGVVSSLAEGTPNLSELALTSLFAVLFVALIAHWGRKTVNRVMPGLEKRLRLGEAEFALAMILLFGLAALSVWVGVAPIIGAFLAGMAMGESLPARVHVLAHGITEFLVPFFLVGIGLHFKLAIFANGSAIALALVLIVAAVLTKVVGCGLGALGFGPRVAARVGLGMVPRGELCMIVAQVGLGLKAITDDSYAVIVFMAVVVTMLTPPLLKLAFRDAPQPGTAVEETFRIA
jgi:Kef-type K+ transport system membrane component KefB